MAKTYIYKLVSKYFKHPELLLEYGFNYYTDEEQEMEIFAYPIALSQDNPLFIQCVRFFEHCYMQATTEEREELFQGYEFKQELLPNQKNVERLVLTDEVVKEFSQAQICVTVNKREKDKGILFVNSPIQNTYYNYETVRGCAPDLIEKLLKDKVVYARRYIYSSR